MGLIETVRGNLRKSLEFYLKEYESRTWKEPVSLLPQNLYIEIEEIASSINLISDIISYLDWGLWDKKTSKEIISENPWLTLLRKPAKYLSFGLLMNFTSKQYEVWHNAFWYIHKNDKNIPVSIQPLLTKDMRLDIKEDKDTKEVKITYVYQKRRGKAGKEFDESEILHFKYFGIDEFFLPNAGLSNLTGLYRIAKYCDALLSKGMKQGRKDKVVIETDRFIAPKRVQRMETRINNILSSEDKTVAVLEEKMKAKPLGVAPEPPELTIIRNSIAKRIYAWFRIPPSIMGEKATYASMEGARKAFYEFAIVTRLFFFREMFNVFFLPEDIEFRWKLDNLRAFISDDLNVARMDRLRTDSGHRTPGEIRAERGFGKKEDAPYLILDPRKATVAVGEKAETSKEEQTEE